MIFNLSINNFWEEVKQSIFVIQQLIRRDKQHNYSSTFFGELWEVMNPLINMVAMVLIFGEMFGRGQSGQFPVYILIGTTIFELFSSGTMLCLNSLIGNKNFLIKTQISKNVFIYEKVYLAFRSFLFSLIIFALVISVYHIPLRLVWLWVIPDILLLLLLIVGIGKILAVINVTFADITYFYKIFTVILFYGSGLFYQVDNVAKGMQRIMMLNPIYVSVTIARKAILEGKTASIGSWLILLIYGITIYCIGTVFFNKASENIVSKM